MEEYFGTKELYKLAIKATDNMKIGNRNIIAGEPILFLENVQLASLAQNAMPIAARGGRKNLPHIFWESYGDVEFRISEGTITPTGLALVTNMRMLENPQNGQLILSKTETIDLDSTGKGTLKFNAIMDPAPFVYNFSHKIIQERLALFNITDNIIDCGAANAFKTILIDYKFYYGEPCRKYILDKSRFNGFFSVEGRFYTQDEENGMNRTNILTLPKVKIVSNLVLRIGEMSNPVTSVFQIVAMAASTDVSESCIMDIVQLEEDIDGDI